jgi:hypothetical protein
VGHGSPEINPLKPFGGRAGVAAGAVAANGATAVAAGTAGAAATAGVGAFGNRLANGLPAGISEARSPGKLTDCGSGRAPGTWGSDTSAEGIKPCAGAGAAAATGAAAVSGAAASGAAAANGAAGAAAAWGSVTEAVAAGAAAGAAAAGATAVAGEPNAEAKPCSNIGALAGDSELRNGMLGRPGTTGAGAGSAEAVELSSSAPGSAHAAAIMLVAKIFLARGMVFPIRWRHVRERRYVVTGGTQVTRVAFMEP